MNAKPKVLKPGRARRPAPSRSRALVAALLLVGTALSLPAAAQPAQPRVGQGSLLVTSDEIDDASWAQTVVLVLHHDSNGTVGVAINRPTEVRLEEIVPDLGDVPGLAGGVYRGGPVRPTQLVFLLRDPPPDVLRNAPRILDGVYASGDLAVLPEIAALADADRLRLYAGHVEWAPGQLEREIRDERWTVTNGSPDRVFAPNPSLLWQRLRNAGAELLVDGSHREAPAVDSAAHPLLAAFSRTRRPGGPEASTDPR